MGEESQFLRSCSSQQFVVDDLESINTKMSDRSENGQATNTLTWQRTQRGEPRLSLRCLCLGSPRPAWRRLVESRWGLVTFRPKVFLLFPALVSDIVGW